MKIAGIQKMTLLDYPGRVACTVFLPGCNFRCPFCHNGGLLESSPQGEIEPTELLEFLKKRRDLLDGVCITGGEPTLQPQLRDLITNIKKLGYCVKLDTNGSRPKVLRKLVEDGLVDYVAMDVKNSPEMYRQTTGTEDLVIQDIEESIRFLSLGNVDYEFRTTLVDELHSEQSVMEMGQWIERLAAPNKAKRLFLQPFVDRESVLFSGLNSPSFEKIEEYVKILSPFVGQIAVRGQ